MPDALPARRVLVVEDEPLIRILVLSLLESGGFAAMGAGTAAEAIDALASTDREDIAAELAARFALMAGQFGRLFDVLEAAFKISRAEG